MTLDDLEKLQEIEERCTPGPWFVRWLDDQSYMSSVAISTDRGSVRNIKFNNYQWDSSDIVALFLLQSPDLVNHIDGKYSENVEMVCAVRNILPELIRLAKLGLDHKEDKQQG